MSDLAHYEAKADRNALAHDRIIERARQLEQYYKSRGLIIAWDICLHEAEDEYDASMEPPERDE